MDTRIDKILFCGANGVGKSSIIQRWIDKEFIFKQQSSHTMSFYYKSLALNENNILLPINEISGDHECVSIVPSFCQTSNFIVLVFDVHSCASFKKLGAYIEEIKKYESREQAKQYILLANKTDITLESGRAVSSQEAEKFAKERGASYFEVSAETGHGISEFEGFIKQHIIQQQNATPSKSVATPVTRYTKHPDIIEKIIKFETQFAGNENIKTISAFLRCSIKEHNATAYLMPKLPELRDKLETLGRTWFSVLNSMMNLTMLLGLTASVAGAPLLYCLGMTSGFGWIIAAVIVLATYSIANKRSSGDAFMFFAFGEKQQAQLLCNEVFRSKNSQLKV